MTRNYEYALHCLIKPSNETIVYVTWAEDGNDAIEKATEDLGPMKVIDIKKL